MSTVKNIKPKFSSRKVVAATFLAEGRRVLAVSNEYSAAFYAVGYSTVYSLEDLQTKPSYSPIYEGDTITLEF
jgi:hypothetical protein